MTRFNYLAPRRRLPFAAATTFAIDNRVRGPLAALFTSTLLTAALSAVQLERLQSAHTAYERAAVALAAGEPALHRAIALREEVVRRAQLDAYAGGIREASLAHADELIWIGNRLPAHTWLRSLRFENGSYALEGVSDRAADVGAAMIALHDAVRGTTPQLVSLQADSGAQPVPVAYTLRVDVRH